MDVVGVAPQIVHGQLDDAPTDGSAQQRFPQRLKIVREDRDDI
jgi:hypothetical protein